MAKSTSDNQEPILSLSKENGDFIVQPFKGSGKGGQKRNKTMSACRITHPASGAVSECQEERSFEQNKQKAFERLMKKPKFQSWLEIEKARAVGKLDQLNRDIDRAMKEKNIKTETRDERGIWVENNDIR